jgi:hypothetical protein
MPGTLTLNCAGSPAPPVTPISTLQNVTSRKLNMISVLTQNLAKDLFNMDSSHHQTFQVLQL